MRTLRTAGSASPPSSCTCELRISSRFHGVTHSFSLVTLLRTGQSMLRTSNAVIWSRSAYRAPSLITGRTTPEEGGETVFPQGRPATSGAGWSDCAKEVRPGQGRHRLLC
jgi:hypothetical protein